jgi:hypothetical protein
MDKFNNMGGGDSAYGNGNHERQTKPNLVHDWARKVAS